MKKFKCTVCGYIHEGDEPPDECPVCGADKSKFIEITDEPQVETPPASPPAEPPRPPFFSRLILRNHLHPIFVHFPNGLIPTSIVFMAIAILLGKELFAKAAYYNLTFVLLTYPLVIITGLTEWRYHYKSSSSPLFLLKIFSALLLGLLLIVVFVWKIFQPSIMAEHSTERTVYLAVHIAILICAGIAGHIGGKLVFKNN